MHIAAPRPDTAAAALRGMAIPIRSWTKIRNSGDAITAYLVDGLLGGLPYQAEPTASHVLASGSILFMANSRSLIWGSGVLNKIAHLPGLVPQQVRALRGRLSADFLVQKGVHLGHIPFGDPGLFAADLLRSAGHVATRRYRVAIVPHHDSMTSPVFRQAASRDDVCVVDILSDRLDPIRQIADSDVVLSQSLHGLIYAESLGKPSLWISHRSDEVWRFKFDDWFSTTYNPQIDPAGMDVPIDRLIGLAELRYSSVRKEDLLAAFPCELAEMPVQGRLAFQTCRAMAPPIFFFDDQVSDGGQIIAHDDRMALLSPRIMAMRDALFANWSERTYSVAASVHARRVPTAAQCVAIAAEMDRRASVDYAVVVPEPADLPESASRLRLADGVFFYHGLPAGGDVLMLRPSHAQLTGQPAVFSV